MNEKVTLKNFCRLEPLFKWIPERRGGRPDRFPSLDFHSARRHIHRVDEASAMKESSLQERKRRIRRARSVLQSLIKNAEEIFRNAGDRRAAFFLKHIYLRALLDSICLCLCLSRLRVASFLAQVTLSPHIRHQQNEEKKRKERE